MPIWLGTSSAAPVIDKVTDRAINSGATALNLCGFQHAVGRRDSSFDHSIEIRQIPKELIKRFRLGVAKIKRVLTSPRPDAPTWNAMISRVHEELFWQ